ncbi:hypothetical protein, partial [Halorubrum distributum]|uniref:hypothetical protein n=1 Tax=Halorubrum distributum TaxID=29283 RepID=UPI00195536E8
QTASISGLIWRNITVRASQTVVTRRQNKATTLDDVPEVPGEYVASVRLANMPSVEPVTFNIARAAREHDSECARIRLLIRKWKDDERPSISFRGSPADEFWSCDPNAK